MGWGAPAAVRSGLRGSGFNHRGHFSRSGEMVKNIMAGGGSPTDVVSHPVQTNMATARKTDGLGTI